MPRQGICVATIIDDTLRVSATVMSAFGGLNGLDNNKIHWRSYRIDRLEIPGSLSHSREYPNLKAALNIAMEAASEKLALHFTA